MALRSVHPQKSAFALALVLSTAGHAAVATSVRSRTPRMPVSTSSAFEVYVEPAPDDPLIVAPSHAPEERPGPPVAPAARAQGARGEPLAPLEHDKTGAPSPPHTTAATGVAATPNTAPRAEASALLGAPPLLPRFAMSMASSGPAGDAMQSANGRTSLGGLGALAEPLPERAVDVPARLQRGETPRYPPDALADAIEGDVQLELVVSQTGDVESAKVVVPAGHRFDEEAIASARRFRFVPAVKDGHPVRVRVHWTVAFRLR